MTKLAQEFTSMAVTYATIIITELCLPNDLKTVRPADMGGTAGGQKFVVQGILFKIGTLRGHAHKELPFIHSYPALCDAALDVQLGPGMYMYGDKEPRNEFGTLSLSLSLSLLFMFVCARTYPVLVDGEQP